MNKSFDVVRLMLDGLMLLYIVAAMTLIGIPVWNNIAYALGISLFILYILRSILTPKPAQSWLFYLYPFLLLLVINGVRSYPDILYLKYFLITWIPMIAAVLHLNDKRSIKLLFYATLISSIINFLAVIFKIDAYVIYSMQSDELESSVLARPGGLTGNANLYAIQAFLPLVFFIGHRSHFPKSIWFIAFSLFLYALNASASRKALTLLIIIILFIIVTAAFRRSGRFFITLISSISLIFISTSIRSPGTIETFYSDMPVIQRTFAIRYGDNSFDIRSQMVDDGIALFLERPILGHGLDYFRHGGGHGTYSHNNFIELLVSGGIALLITYLIVILRGILSVAVYRRSEYRAQIISYIFLTSIVLFLDMSMVTYVTPATVLIILLLVSGKFLPNNNSRHNY